MFISGVSGRRNEKCTARDLAEIITDMGRYSPSFFLFPDECGSPFITLGLIKEIKYTMNVVC
jgi:hypothetical protein